MYLLTCSLVRDYEEMAPMLVSGRRERYERLIAPDARRQFLAAEWLLQKGLKTAFGVEYGQVRFEYGAQGKPFLASHPAIHFNLSHTDSCAVCALSEAPVGVDVQTVRTFDLRVLGRFCNTSELEWVQADPDFPERATRLWTLKEAYAKWTGEGLSSMGKIHFYADGASLRADCANGYAVSFKRDDCWISIFCCNSDQTFTEIS